MVKLLCDLVDKYPNDMELGSEVRKWSYLAKFVENDQDLGKYIRSKRNKIWKQF